MLQGTPKKGCARARREARRGVRRRAVLGERRVRGGRLGRGLLDAPSRHAIDRRVDALRVRHGRGHALGRREAAGEDGGRDLDGRHVKRGVRERVRVVRQVLQHLRKLVRERREVLLLLLLLFLLF